MEVILLRHADAVKARLGEPDWSRPLSTRGEEQARTLADVLGPRMVTEILSSSAMRCRATVSALAQRQGLEILEEPLLAEAAPDPYELATLSDRLEAASGTVVVCGHAPMLTRLLVFIVGRQGLSLPPDEVMLRPSSAVVLSYRASPPHRLETLVRLDPPRWLPRRLVG